AEGGSTLGAPELVAFFSALVAFTLLFSWLLAIRVRLGRLEDLVDELEVVEQSPGRASTGAVPVARMDPA
nr:hypothetical protein [Actinomycetota bacterium]